MVDSFSEQRKSGNVVPKWVVGITGSSGMPYAIRLIDFLENAGVELHIIVSEAGLRVLAEESNILVSSGRLNPKKLIGRDSQRITFYNPRDIGAAPASGSKLFDGMVIVPCSMATLGMVSHGTGINLIHRAADVTLKEGRKLVIVPRETPFSSIHLENMLKLSQLGVRVVAACPGFYTQPQSLSDIVDMLVMKILDSMGIANNLMVRWGESAGEPAAEGNKDSKMFAIK